MEQNGWKKHLNTILEGEKKEITVIKGGESLVLPLKKVDQGNGNNMRSWDELSLEERVDRLGKLTSFLLHKTEE